MDKSTKTSFWTACPKKLGYLPDSPCSLGKLGADSKGDSELSCLWYINSSEHNYCFWKWIRNVSNEDGFFEPLMHHELSTLLKWSSTKLHFTLKQAIQNLENIEEFKELKNYLKEE